MGRGTQFSPGAPLRLEPYQAFVIASASDAKRYCIHRDQTVELGRARQPTTLCCPHRAPMVASLSKRARRSLVFRSHWSRGQRTPYRAEFAAKEPAPCAISARGRKPNHHNLPPKITLKCWRFPPKRKLVPVHAQRRQPLPGRYR